MSACYPGVTDMKCIMDYPYIAECERSTANES